MYLLKVALLIVVVAVPSYLVGKYTCEPKTTHVRNQSCPEPSCKRYRDHIEEWITAFTKKESEWLQCQRDLAQTQEALNYDISCSYGVCLNDY